jgi:CHAT domain-containing protein/ATP/maltotriose-dependent transcriptional regulator MalT
MKKYILALIFVGSCVTCFAQEQKTELKKLSFRILSIANYHDTAIAYIYGGTKIGLSKLLPIKAYQRYLPATADKPSREMKEVGAGAMYQVTDSSAWCIIYLYDPKDTLDEEDVIQADVLVPIISYRGYFSDLVFKGIEFRSLHYDYFYSLTDLLYHDSPKTEDSVLHAMVNDVHELYKTIDENKNTDAWKPTYVNGIVPITAGRYKGKTALDVIRNASRKDIEAFLLYVQSFPSRYHANVDLLVDDFWVWVLGDAPAGVMEIKKILYPIYKNKVELAKLLPLYKSDIKEQFIISNIAYEATFIAAAKKFTEAYNQVQFAKFLAYATNDTSAISYVHTCTAEILYKDNKLMQAIKECDPAIQYAYLAKTKYHELNSLLSKGFYLYKAAQYSAAENILSIVSKKLGEYKPAISDVEYQSILSYLYNYYGSIDYEKGDYTTSLAYYDTATQINNYINSLDTKVRNAEIYTFIGRVKNDQGLPSDALKAFFDAQAIYRNLNDYYNSAMLINEIAYSYYNLGNYRYSIINADIAYNEFIRLSEYNDAGYSKSLMGSCYWELGQYDSAVVAHKESIALRKLGNNLSGQAFSWKKLGELYQQSGLKKQALSAFDSAAFFYKRINDNSGLAETYIKKGKVFYNDENYKKAVDLFEKAQGITSKTTVEALYNLGNSWSEIDTAKARRYFTACKQKSDSTGNVGYLFYSTKALAGLAYRSHDARSGDKLYDECLSISKQLNTAESYAYCLALKAQHYYIETELDSALQYYTEARNILDTVSKDDVIWQLNNISDVYVSRGDFASAESALSKAIEMASATNNNLALGYSLQSSSFLSGLTAEFEKGITNNDSALAIFQKSGNMLRLANTYVSRGTLLKSMGQFKQSINAFLFADSLYREEGTDEYRQTVSIDIGVTYYDQADYQIAIKYFEKGLQQMKQGVIDESYLLCKANIAECLIYLKKNKEAETIYLQVFPPAKQKKLNRIASGMAIGLGKLYYNTGELSRATDYLIEARDYALASSEKEKIIEALTYLGRIAVQSGKPDSAENNFRRAASVVAKYKLGGGWEPYYELGLLFYNQKKFDSSIVYFKNAADLLDKDAENLYGGEEAKKIFNNDPRKSDLYNKITFAYYNIGNEKEAWAYANRSNIAGIKEKSGGLSASANDKEKMDALKQLATLQQTKKALEATAEKQKGEEKEQTLKKIEILEDDYTNFLQDVIAKDSTLSDYFAKSDADEFYNYKEKLPNNVAVALYMLNDKTLMIITLTNEKLAIDTMTADISKTVSAFISATKQPQRATGTGPLKLRSEPTDEDETIMNIPFKDLSDKLYNTLITPVDENIKNKQRLCIIPTGIFSNMPFQCLGKKMPDSSFHFLIEDHAIFYTNKMKIFENTHDTIRNMANLYSFAAFGVPDKTLKYNTAEVKEIGKILGIDSTIYADGRATESMAKTSLIQKKYIHFATHGVLNYSNEFSQSYLKFLPDKDSSNGNNGQLTIREIQRLGIRDCNLVILSACETAINKELVKGWNISPANAFLERRVKSVIASLWKVDDEATNILMNEFYKNLKIMSTVDALRLAQETLSRNPKYSHPFYWGAFVLYGDWR